jgi:hypothetical protein
VQLVATFLHGASLTLGIPSFIGFVFLAWESARLHMIKVPAESGRSGNQLIDLLVAGVQTFGKVFGLLGEAAQWFLTLLAGVSLLSTLFAVMLFFTARGLQSGRAWARALGILLALLPFLISLLMVLSTRRFMPMTFGMLIAAASGYVLWALCLRFA